MHGGVSEAVHGWLDAWQQELRETSRSMLQEVEAKSDIQASVLQGVLRDGVGQIRSEVSGLEQVMSRPRPVQIRISGDAELERSAQWRLINGFKPRLPQGGGRRTTWIRAPLW